MTWMVSSESCTRLLVTISLISRTARLRRRGFPRI